MSVGFFGNATISFRILTAGGAQTQWANATIQVIPINQPPSFGLTSSLTVLEDSPPFSETRFAFNISKGIYPEASELGIYYTNSPFRANEESQKVTFSVVLFEGDPQVFAEPPYLHANGTLTFSLVPDLNGEFVFGVTLKDDGGNDGGFSTEFSELQNFTLIVTPVNDAPSFSVPTTFQFIESNESRPVVALSFASAGVWAEGFQGPANELDQEISFVLALVDGSSALFESEPNITSTGSLEFQLAAFQWGQATFSIFLQDSGGNTSGGIDVGYDVSGLQNFTIEIVAVNTRPTLGLATTLTLWSDPYSTLPVINPESMLVRDSCCALCPGPAEGCAVEPCCSPVSSSGALREVLSMANASAGPYENQNLTFTVSVIGSSNLFASVPSIEPDGKILFNLIPGETGSASLRIRLQDSGGQSSFMDVDNVESVVAVEVMS
eukprot:1498857-Rhodomonas_salina.1